MVRSRIGPAAQLRRKASCQLKLASRRESPRSEGESRRQAASASELPFRLGRQPVLPTRSLLRRQFAEGGGEKPPLSSHEILSTG